MNTIRYVTRNSRNNFLFSRSNALRGVIQHRLFSDSPAGFQYATATPSPTSLSKGTPHIISFTKEKPFLKTRINLTYKSPLKDDFRYKVNFDSVLNDFLDCQVSFHVSIPEMSLAKSHSETGLSPKTAEIAFCGRSNAGKSSMLNCLFGLDHQCRRSAAITSKKPGRTQMVNLFHMKCPRGKVQLVLADLPGVGFAQVDLETRKRMDTVLRDYLKKREELKYVMFLVDTNKGLTQQDRKFLKFLEECELRYFIILTKVDSVTEERFKKVVDNTVNYFNAGNNPHCMPYIHCTSVLGTTFGIDELMRSVGGVANF